MNEIGLERKSSAGGATPLADKLKEHVRQTGALTSGDIATFVKEQNPEPSGPPPGAAMVETTVVDKPPSEAVDPMVTLATEHKTPGEQVGKLQDAIAATGNIMQAQQDRKQKIIVTPEDKDAFVTALIAETRMELTIRRCGGRVLVVVRSRTVPESQAILAYMQRQIIAKKIETQADYTNHLRAAMLSAQIMRFNGKDYKPLQEPLMPVQDIVNKTTIPAGWEGGLDHWLTMGEAAYSLLWSCIEEFEDKYWRMIEDAKDQNFWNPAASI